MIYNEPKQEMPQSESVILEMYERILSSFFLQSKKEGKDQESIQSSTTPDPGYKWESDNVTIKHHKREPRGQPFPSR